MDVKRYFYEASTVSQYYRVHWYLNPCWLALSTNTLHSIKSNEFWQISQLHGTGKVGCRPVATGNWGCGNSLKGDVQLKLVIQWMAASVSGIPLLLYYTSGNEKLTKVIKKHFIPNNDVNVKNVTYFSWIQCAEFC